MLVLNVRTTRIALVRTLVVLESMDAKLLSVAAEFGREMIAHCNESGIPAAEVPPERKWNQFFFTKETARRLASESLGQLRKARRSGSVVRVACVACPSVMEAIVTEEEVEKGEVEAVLFDIDDRFAERFPGRFVKMDLEAPEALDQRFRERFDLVVAATPYLTQQCLGQVVKVVTFLLYWFPGFVFLCTTMLLKGAVEEYLPNFRSTSFDPKHAKGAPEEFLDYKCFSTCRSDTFTS
ncbi:hypothetical protein QR680_012403 [Steinernema hermaphroditum]|uniref:Uncharacterized protein n=1 Tax=Steinernema hermaphroditum TaxID=289476 RepID=A0AA39I390_9BILA|nr:hypothetical protein QR680_012403 [Steinernema hermaphroditum]